MLIQHCGWKLDIWRERTSKICIKLSASHEFPLGMLHWICYKFELTTEYVSIRNSSSLTKPWPVLFWPKNVNAKIEFSNAVAEFDINAFNPLKSDQIQRETITKLVGCRNGPTVVCFNIAAIHQKGIRKIFGCCYHFLITERHNVSHCDSVTQHSNFESDSLVDLSSKTLAWYIWDPYYEWIRHIFLFQILFNEYI